MSIKTIALILAMTAFADGQMDVDKTCATCSRRANDSLNLKVRNIRLNQVGYLPQDGDKSAHPGQSRQHLHCGAAEHGGWDAETGNLSDRRQGIPRVT